MKKITAQQTKRLLLVFLALTVLWALARLVFLPVGKAHSPAAKASSSHPMARIDTGDIRQKPSCFFATNGKLVKHAIIGVPDYETSFPDMNDVQLPSAKRYGVSPVQNRAEAEQRKHDLVFVGYNPYYEVKKLYNSIPYLVPSAAVLLQDIGRNFMDSLQLKNIPINKLFVTSVLRTKEDVIKLRSFNRNASENSCHQYGTTFDIAYNKYYALTRPVRDDTLKWVLAEVLHDLRSQSRCYVKHERHQGCFHITVR